METPKATLSEKLKIRFGVQDNIDLPLIPSLGDWNKLGKPEKDAMREMFRDKDRNLDELIKVHSDGCKDHEFKGWRVSPRK